LRKYLIAALVAVLSLALAAVAIGQTTGDVSATTTVSPSKSGTKKKPKATKVTTFVKNNVPNTTASKIEIDFPKNVKISGKGLTKCAVSEFSKPGGKSNCNKKSLAGTGLANAVVGPERAPPLEGECRLGRRDEQVHRVAAEPPGGARGAVRHLDAEPRLAGGLVDDAAPFVELAGRRQQQAGPALSQAAQHAGEGGRGGGRRRREYEDEIVAARGGRRRLARERVIRAPAEPGEGRRDRGGQMQLFQCGHGCLG